MHSKARAYRGASAGHAAIGVGVAGCHGVTGVKSGHNLVMVQESRRAARARGVARTGGDRAADGAHRDAATSGQGCAHARKAVVVASVLDALLHERRVQQRRRLRPETAQRGQRICRHVLSLVELSRTCTPTVGFTLGARMVVTRAGRQVPNA